MADETAPDEYLMPCVFLPLATGTPVAGLWCDTCLLPSRYEVPVYVLGDDGPSQIGTAGGCTEHQQ